METLADPDLERPRVPATRSKSKIRVPKRPKVTNPGPVPKEKRLKVSKGKPKSKRKAPVLTDAMQTDNIGSPMTLSSRETFPLTLMLKLSWKGSSETA